MRDKLFNKFFLTTFCIIIFSIAVMFVLLCVFMSSFLAHEKRSALIENCAAATKLIDDGSSVKTDKRLYTMLETLASTSSAELFITDADGNVKLCTCDVYNKSGVCVHSESRMSDNVLKNAADEEYFEVTNLDGALPDAVYCAAKCVKNNNITKWYVFAVSPTSSLQYFYSKVFGMFMLSASLSLILLFLAEYWQIYKIRKPLKIMSEAARCVSRGDFTKRIPVISNDEIGELSVAFNQMTNSLVRLEKMRRSFVANVSHELKTPMTTIAGFVDGINDGTIPPEKQGYYLHIVSDEVRRLSRIVQSMLSLSKIESGETKINAVSFDLTDTVVKILIAQEQRIENKNISVVGLDTMPHITVNADRDLIYQVVYNLIDNAVKFTDTGGTITVLSNSDGKNIKFSIRNTGEGIPQSELPFVFDRFYKIDRSRAANKESSGLGLHIAKTIIGAHSGQISVTSVENAYTEFTFILPINA